MPPLNRRNFLKTAAVISAGTALSAPAWSKSAAANGLAAAQVPFLKPGQVLQEATSYPDRLTGRTVTKLTARRDFNQLPTYHNNSAFTADSRALIFASWPKDMSVSYLMKAELDTGAVTVIAALPRDLKRGHFIGNSLAIEQKTAWALVNTYAAIYAYDRNTFEEKTLLPITPQVSFGHPAGSIDGKTMYLARNGEGSAPFKYTILAVEIATGAVKELFAENNYHCVHLQPSTMNPDEFLVAREPKLLAKKKPVVPGIYETPRMIIWNRATGGITPLSPVMDPKKWITHMVWNYRGERLFYEMGDSKEAKQHEIGVFDRSGKNLWHMINNRSGHKVHVGAHTQKDWMILEGGYFAGQRKFTFFKFDQTDKSGNPAQEDIALHESEADETQESHGHPQVSPDGQWMCFNELKNGRSDVFVVRLD